MQQSQLERKQRGLGVVMYWRKCDEIACVLEASPIMIIVMTMQLWLYIVRRLQIVKEELDTADG